MICWNKIDDFHIEEPTALSLGKFDAAGQVSAIELAAGRLRQELQALESRRRERCRSYETIGVCAGLALAVILL